MKKASPRIEINGATLVADRSGAAFWEARQTLIVSDLHFEKGSALAKSGALLPPYDTRATLLSLTETIDRFLPQRVICLGDSFHDSGAEARMQAQDRAALAALIRRLDWIWIAGNHDPIPPDDLGGVVEEELVDGPFLFRHEADHRFQGAGEISGHFHPKALISTRARRHRGPCFVSDGKRLIMPAFGAYTGGLSVTDQAIKALFPQGFDLWLLGKSKAYFFPGHVAQPFT